MAAPTCESEYGIYGCGAGGTPRASARPWVAVDLLPRNQPRYNMESSFYDTRQFGGAFGPVVIGNPVGLGLENVARAAQAVMSQTPVANRNHIESNTLAPILILAIAALILLK